MSAQPLPALRKARRVTGKTLSFRDAAVANAEFILGLRNDPVKNRYLSATPDDLEAQRNWLSRYADATDQVYFIIEHAGQPIGTVRLYDARQDSFCWGSWILADGRPQHAAMESALMVYAYAMDHLGFRAAYFDVRKGNERVWRFHERFGARRVHETELDYLYELAHEDICASRGKYQKFLAEPLIVDF
jgi:RimJ/RimL family protein N-acetyltransferase